MWIKKLYATFGKLEDKTLGLNSGLNIIYGENESGKSTWSAFIRAMFYGISTRDQKKTGYLPDKEKFIPWNGSPMYGKMEISAQGGDITIERTSKSAGVFSKVVSCYDESGREAPHGEDLIGVSASVYDRTAFIRQTGIELSKDADTEKRILSIASSGDETVSTGEIINRLKKKQRELRSVNRLGKIPKLEDELSLLCEKTESAKEAESEALRISESIKAYKDEEKRAKRLFSIAKSEEEKTKLSYIFSARKKLEEAAERLRELEGAPTRRELDTFLEKKSECEKARLSYEQNEKLYASVCDELLSLREEVSASHFCGKSREKVLEETRELLESLKKPQKNGKTPVYFAILLFFAAVILSMSGLFFSPLLFIPAVFSVCSGIYSIVIAKKRRSEKESASGLREKYGVSDVFELQSSAERYLSLIERESELVKAEKEAELTKEKSRSELDFLNRDIKKLSETFSLEEENLDEAEKKLRKLTEEREEAFNAERAARARVEALDAAAEVCDNVPGYTPEEIPDRDSAFFEAELLTLAEKIRVLEIALAEQRAKLSGFSFDEAEKKRLALTDELNCANLEYDAIDFAIDMIDEADTELKNRFSPEIEKRTSEIFSELTGGSFEIVRIKSESFDVDVAKSEASAPRDGLFLSRGTLDELYFALRIALFETIIPEENAPPMILDDVFVNFDDERMKRALLLLREIAEKRQVILFSCHTREAEFFKEDEKVHIIKL